MLDAAEHYEEFDLEEAIERIEAKADLTQRRKLESARETLAGEELYVYAALNCQNKPPTYDHLAGNLGCSVDAIKEMKDAADIAMGDSAGADAADIPEGYRALSARDVMSRLLQSRKLTRKTSIPFKVDETLTPATRSKVPAVTFKPAFVDGKPSCTITGDKGSMTLKPIDFQVLKALKPGTHSTRPTVIREVFPKMEDGESSLSQSINRIKMAFDITTGNVDPFFQSTRLRGLWIAESVIVSTLHVAQVIKKPETAAPVSKPVKAKAAVSEPVQKPKPAAKSAPAPKPAPAPKAALRTAAVTSPALRPAPVDMNHPAIKQSAARAVPAQPAADMKDAARHIRSNNAPALKATHDYGWFSVQEFNASASTQFRIDGQEAFLDPNCIKILNVLKANEHAVNAVHIGRATNLNEAQVKLYFDLLVSEVKKAMKPKGAHFLSRSGTDLYRFFSKPTPQPGTKTVPK